MDNHNNYNCNEMLSEYWHTLIMEQVVLYGQTLYKKVPYHTSALMGEMWVLEPLNGHLEWICSELGVHKYVFLHPCENLWWYGHQSSKHVLLEEQLTIFLYTCVMGLSIQHVSEWFQHATDTTSYCTFVYGRNPTSSVTGCHIFWLSNQLILCVTQGKVSNSGPGLYTIIISDVFSGHLLSFLFYKYYAMTYRVEQVA